LPTAGKRPQPIDCATERFAKDEPEMQAINMNSETAPLWTLPCFEDELARILSAREKKTLSPEGLVVAAVLVPLFTNNGHRYVLLTERSHLVEHHRGEISFPGGKFDPTDADLKSCALR
jgi:hypothetical protein